MYTNLSGRFIENIGKTNKEDNNYIKSLGKQNGKFFRNIIKNSYGPQLQVPVGF